MKHVVVEYLLTFDSTKLLLNHVLQFPLIPVVTPELLESFKSAYIPKLHGQPCGSDKHKDGSLTLSRMCSDQTPEDLKHE